VRTVAHRPYSTRAARHCDLIRAREALDGEIFPRTDGVAQAHRLVLHAGLGRAFGADDEVDRWRALADADDNYGEAWIMTHVSSSEATGSTWPQCMFWSVLQKPQPRCSTQRVRTCRREDAQRGR
jgi:hypothetical protein